MNGNAMNAKLELRREFGQCFVGTLAASEAVGENADMVAARGLSLGEIEDVTENPADRRAYRMQDTKRLVWLRGHGQNQRSATRMVSPGLSEVPSGTITRVEPELSEWVSVTWPRRARGENPPAIATALLLRSRTTATDAAVCMQPGRASAASGQGMTERTLGIRRPN
jgi:hypothetical protein